MTKNYLAQTSMCSFLFLQDPNSGFSFQCSHRRSGGSTHFALGCSHSGGICQQEAKLQFSRTSLKLLSASANQQLMAPLKWQELLTKKQQTLEILDDRICSVDSPELPVLSPHKSRPVLQSKGGFQIASHMQKQIKMLLGFITFCLRAKPFRWFFNLGMSKKTCCLIDDCSCCCEEALGWVSDKHSGICSRKMGQSTGAVTGESPRREGVGRTPRDNRCFPKYN